VTGEALNYVKYPRLPARSARWIDGQVWYRCSLAQSLWPLNYGTEERTGVPKRAARLGWWMRPGRAQ